MKSKHGKALPFRGGLPYGYALRSAAGIAAVVAATAVVGCCVAVTAYAEQENKDDDPAARVTAKVEA